MATLVEIITDLKNTRESRESQMGIFVDLPRNLVFALTCLGSEATTLEYPWKHRGRAIEIKNYLEDHNLWYDPRNIDEDTCGILLDKSAKEHAVYLKLKYHNNGPEMGSASDTVSFGKYKGKSIPEMQKDKNYLAWLRKQEWAVEKYPEYLK